MPKSTTSYRSVVSEIDDEDDIAEHEEEALRNSYLNAFQSQTAPVSPVDTRRNASLRASDLNLRGRLPSRLPANESTGLLSSAERPIGDYRTLPASAPGTPRYGLVRNLSHASSLNRVRARHHSRRGSFGMRLARALTDGSRAGPNTPATGTFLYDDRVWYDQFTSTDW
jgi:chloride channel 3/4/5